MNYTLQLHSNNRTYPVPRGLHDLMADIAREVLRHKPLNIENFIYKYLDSLMRIKRVAKGVAGEVDKAISAGAKKTTMLYDLGLSIDEADNAASRLQALIRGHMARKQFKDLITKKDHQDVCQPDISYVTSRILKKYNLTAAQANAICTKIQAAFRGWMVRRSTLCNVPSHESWRHDWLWKEFQMSPSEVKAVTNTEKKSHSKGEELLFQPRRSIDIDHIKFMKAFKGELADYDDGSDTSSIGDTTPSEEHTEGKRTETEEEKAVEEPKATEHIHQEKKETIEAFEKKIKEPQEASTPHPQKETVEEIPIQHKVTKHIEHEKTMEEEFESEGDIFSLKDSASEHIKEHPHEEHPHEERIHEEHVHDDHAHEEHAHDEHAHDEHAHDEHAHDEHAHDDHAHDEHAHEEQEYIVKEFEHYIEEEHEVFQDNIGSEEFEYYFENKFGEVEGIVHEEFMEEE